MRQVGRLLAGIPGEPPHPPALVTTTPTAAPAVTVPGQIHNPLLNADWNNGQVGFLNKLITVFLGWGLLIAVLVFVFVFLFGGIGWILAGGDENKVKAARGRLTSGLVGISIVFLLFMFLKLIGTVFGIGNLENLRLTVPVLQ